MVEVSAKNRVLFVAFQTPNRANGGLESMFQLIKGMKEWEKHIITQRHSDRATSWTSEVKLTVLNNLGRWPKLFLIPLFNAFVIFYCIKNKIKILYCNDIDAVLSSAFMAKLIGIHVVFSIRGVKTKEEGYGVKWRIAKKLVHSFLVLSHEMKDILTSRLQIERSRVNVIYSIVDSSIFYPMDKKHLEEIKDEKGVKEGKVNIGIPAAVYSLKQQLEFIKEACPLIIKRIPEVVFYFVGDFDLRNDYCRQCLSAAESIGIEYFKFLGFRPDMSSWYNIFDVTVVSSKREGLSRTMIESLSCATPVVSFDVCSAREILEKYKCGRVAKQADFNTLAQQIIELLNSEDYRVSCDNGRRLGSTLFDKQKSIVEFEKLLTYDGT